MRMAFVKAQVIGFRRLNWGSGVGRDGLGRSGHDRYLKAENICPL
jgi:hypothetical protein